KFTRQNISDIERGRRGISKKVAKKLSAFFNVSVERFI
ncbi:MAG: helix-turn-helix transcriptional regulator, partial [Desulfosarcina sp.]|nr:helix-turn-helix transcriptional regulator [Desulfobacterales bacterium]